MLLLLPLRTLLGVLNGVFLARSFASPPLSGVEKRPGFILGDEESGRRPEGGVSGGRGARLVLRQSRGGLPQKDNAPQSPHLL